MSARLGHGHQSTCVHTTSDPSAPSISQGTSGNVTDRASLQSSRPPAGIGGAISKGPYPCDICGKRYAQRQGVRRHYREIHDHPNSCSYCDFKWTRPYLYKAHLEAKHRDGVRVSDAAQEEPTCNYRVANTTSLPQQQPVLTLTPELSEHGQRGGTETWWCSPIPPPSAVVEVTPARLPAIQRVDHDPQPLGSAEPTIRRKRKREDTPESELHTELLSTEVRPQLANDLDIPVRKVQLG
jgi:hypothetical protein